MIRECPLQRVDDDALGFSIHRGNQIDGALVVDFFRPLPMAANECSCCTGRIPGDADKFLGIHLHDIDLRKSNNPMVPNGP